MNNKELTKKAEALNKSVSAYADNLMGEYVKYITENSKIEGQIITFPEDIEEKEKTLDFKWKQFCNDCSRKKGLFTQPRSAYIKDTIAAYKEDCKKHTWFAYMMKELGEVNPEQLKTLYPKELPAVKTHFTIDKLNRDGKIQIYAVCGIHGKSELFDLYRKHTTLLQRVIFRLMIFFIRRNKVKVTSTETEISISINNKNFVL